VIMAQIIGCKGVPEESSNCAPVSQQKRGIVRKSRRELPDEAVVSWSVGQLVGGRWSVVGGQLGAVHVLPSFTSHYSHYSHQSHVLH